MVEALTRAREAFERHEFAAAAEAFAAADAVAPLGGDDLRLFGEAAWWSGDGVGSITAMERAFKAYQDDGQNVRAAVMALRLCHLAARRLAMSIAAGWMSRAERLLAEEPEGWAHAWLSFMRMMVLVFRDGDLAGAAELSEHTLLMARRHGNAEVESLVLSVQGQLLVGQGRWKEGLELVDEATGAAVSGALEPRTACEVYCFTISTCRNLFDYRRASEWTDEAERFMHANSFRGYPGVCRVHRAELKRLRGSYSEAELEALEACDELEAFHLHDVLGFAHYEVGEIRLRRGDLAAAEESFRRAHEFGRDPQPGWSSMLLAQGKVAEAAEGIGRALGIGRTASGAEVGFQDVLRRSRLLPTQIEVALAAGDLATARAGVLELEASATHFESSAIEAAAAAARGALQLNEGDADAVGTLERAWRSWQQMRMPYESARARLLLGRAHAAAGVTSAAVMELEAARASFERLGAEIDAHRTNQVLRELVGAPGAADGRVAKTFMFTDVVGSTDLVRLMGDAKWERLIAWHDRTLRSIIGEHRGEIVRHTGDGFFVTFTDPAEALACAVAVQRRLEQAGDQGVVLSVRIGLHSSEAGRHGDDYAGLGVHVAARVADLAGGDEIVASRATVEAAQGSAAPATAVGDVRSVTLKGLDEPLEVVTIAWH